MALAHQEVRPTNRDSRREVLGSVVGIGDGSKLPVVALSVLLAVAPVCAQGAGEPAEPGPSARVIAFYYPWHGNPETDGRYANWNHPVAVRNEPPRSFPGGEDIGANLYPAMGCYSVNDPEVLQKHMRQLEAKRRGANVKSVPTFAPQDKTLRAMVEEDWDRQLSSRGRTAHDPAAIREALSRTERLLSHLRQLPNSPILGSWSSTTHGNNRIGIVSQSVKVGTPSTASTGARVPSPQGWTRWNSSLPGGVVSWEETWLALTRRPEDCETLPQAEREELYRALRWAARDLMLRHPSLEGRPIVFMKRRRFICQMLHEYLGYYYDYADIAGGGVHLLQEPGRSSVARDLTGDRLGRGNYTTLALSYDAKTVYFAFAERAPTKPDYHSAERRCFHLFSVNTDGTDLRQLTFGPDDDFDPCPLPDGSLAFMSTRRGGFGRCHNPWEPLPTYTLHCLSPDGAVRTLSWHETNEWHPWVLNDGRIVYTRWDYVDRSAANFHGLWVCNPDGSDPSSLFGNYTMRINACYQPRSIPGSERLVFVAGAHHADVGGALVMLDPRRAALDVEHGEDSLAAIEVLTPEVCFPEAPGWPSSYYHSPWPLSEDCYLVSYSPDPLPGMGPGEERDTKTGLYYFDRFGNLELLYRDPAISCMYPMLLTPREKPPVLPSQLASEMGDEGEFLLADVRRSLFPLPPDRPVKQLRVFQVLPKTGNHVANQPRLGYANAESARMLLGTVPVESDGSAYFRAPARKPLYFQAVDAEGQAVQSMRSVTYLQPGERVGCIGCHEPGGDTPRTIVSLAAQRPPSRIEPGPEGSKPMSFARLVQPVIDRHCVSCHDGSTGEGKGHPVLTDKSAGEFSKSYENLKEFVRWYEWGGASISQIATRPGECGADASPLLRILADVDHAGLALPDPDRRRLMLWLDANAPFYGTYDRESHLAQRRGEPVPPPRVQ